MKLKNKIFLVVAACIVIIVTPMLGACDGSNRAIHGQYVSTWTSVHSHYLPTDNIVFDLNVLPNNTFLFQKYLSGVLIFEFTGTWTRTKGDPHRIYFIDVYHYRHFVVAELEDGRLLAEAGFRIETGRPSISNFGYFNYVQIALIIFSKV